MNQLEKNEASHERRAGIDVRVFLDAFLVGLPIAVYGEPITGKNLMGLGFDQDLAVGIDQVIAKLPLKPFHERNHHDDHVHAQGYPDDGQGGEKGYPSSRREKLLESQVTVPRQLHGARYEVALDSPFAGTQPSCNLSQSMGKRS